MNEWMGKWVIEWVNKWRNESITKIWWIIIAMNENGEGLMDWGTEGLVSKRGISPKIRH